MRMAKSRNSLLITLVICGVLAASILYYKKKFNQSEATERRVKAILTGQLKLPIVPEDISSIPLYQVNLNLWGTLLELNGEPGLARLIGSEEGGKALRFELQPGVRFSNGRQISSEDVIFSLKRLMNRQPGGHFNARLVIDRISSVSPTQFIIFLKEPTPAFLFLLTIPEMGIVPKEVCEKDGTVRDLSVTSGAYFSDQKPLSDGLVLKKNPYFPFHDPKSPDVVQVLFKGDTASILDQSKEGLADFFEFYEGTGLKAFEQLKSNRDFDYLTTRPSYSIFVVANSRSLSREQRISISNLVADRLEKFYKPQDGIEKRSYEMLPPGTFAALGLTEPLHNDHRFDHLPKKLKVATPNQAAPLAQAVASVLRSAGVELTFVEPDDDHYDLYIRGQGMNVDFPEIEFYLSMVSAWNSIPATNPEKDLILKIIHSQNRSDRSEKLQTIERALLDDARIIPLYVRSYVHMFRRGKIDSDKVTTYDGDILFSKMRVIDEK
jgi:ABC-type oligopeptide transport system substrate-binding subunit